MIIRDWHFTVIFRYDLKEIKFETDIRYIEERAADPKFWSLSPSSRNYDKSRLLITVQAVLTVNFK
jgi:hypothetical protein